MLLDPLEEEFDLPSLLIDGSNSCRGDVEIVGEKDQAFVDVGRVKAHASQGRRELSKRILPIENNGLFRTNAGGTIDRVRTAAPKAEILFGANDEEDHRLMEAKEPAEIDISAIHNNEATGVSMQAIQDVRIVAANICNVDKRRDGAVQVEQGVDFDSGLGLLEWSPRK